tara:strand:- start:3 stop:335 length:333 start_codon:yes stop_codon:yes gene_type:complete
MAQLAEYIGVDYPEAINSGQVINDEEYQEMLEFSSILVAQANSSEIGALVSNTQALETSIKEKRAPSVIQQMCNQLRTGLLKQMPQTALPQQLLPMRGTGDFPSICNTFP